MVMTLVVHFGLPSGCPFSRFVACKSDLHRSPACLSAGQRSMGVTPYCVSVLPDGRLVIDSLEFARIGHFYSPEHRTCVQCVSAWKDFVCRMEPQLPSSIVGQARPATAVARFCSESVGKGQDAPWFGEARAATPMT